MEDGNRIQFKTSKDFIVLAKTGFGEKEREREKERDIEGERDTNKLLITSTTQVISFVKKKPNLPHSI